MAGIVSLPIGPPQFFRGTTVEWQTVFRDVNQNVVIPGSATINIVFPDPDPTDDNCDQTQTTSIPMTYTNDGMTWTALLDTRGYGFGEVSWSIHSDPGPTFAVEDGKFVLKGGPANLETFT